MHTLEIAPERKQKMAESGLQTLIEHFYHWEKVKAQEIYLCQPQGDQWIVYTWQEVGQQARRMALALQAMHLPPKSHIGIVSKNCAHWVISDLAIMMSGHISVPLFPTLAADQLAQVLEHSDTKALFVGKLDNWEQMQAGIPEDIQVITYPHYPGAAEVQGENFWKWEDLMNKYEPLQENYKPALSDLITICYTSGTTGKPKGVMLTYYAFARVYEATRKNDEVQLDNPRYFSYLPLNHMAERIVVESGSITSGGKISFVESLETFAQNLAETRPTHFLAVPRIWAKFQQGILAKIPQEKLDRLFKIPIVSGLVKKRIKKGLGLDRAQMILTGAAPMPASLIAWYHQLGLRIREGYGMSENTAACTIMPKDNLKVGTIGKPQPGCEIKIDPDTGEILMRSEWMMEGYYKEPALTERVFQDGWLRTGDKGEFDEEGFLKITGRVKEIFKTAKGEYVSPFILESGFALNDHIEQMCVVGTNLPQPIALITLSEAGQKAPRTEVEKSLKANLEKVNAQVYKYEHIHRLIILPESWSVENGVMTPTLKIKRNVIEDKYQACFEEWYQQDELIIWL